MAPQPPFPWKALGPVPALKAGGVAKRALAGAWRPLAGRFGLEGRGPVWGRFPAGVAGYSDSGYRTIEPIPRPHRSSTLHGGG